jgi:hypothetical protein
VRPSFTPIQNDWQNYGFVYFNLYIPRQQAGRQKTLDRMVASISWIQSALNLFAPCNFYLLQLVLFPNVWTLPHLQGNYSLSLCYDFVLPSNDITLTYAQLGQ